MSSPNSKDRKRGLRNLAAVLLVLAGAAALVLAGGAVAQSGEPIANATVNVTDPVNETVTVDVEFAENNSEVTAYLYNTSEVELANETLIGAAGTTDSAEFNESLLSETGNHTVEVYGNESDVAGLWVSIGNEESVVIAPPEDGQPGFGIAIAALALLAAAGLASRREGS